MARLGRGSRGASTTEYIIILALILGMILILFGRSFIDMLSGQIDLISSSVEPNSAKQPKKKKTPAPLPGEPKLGDGDDEDTPGSPGGPGGLPVSSSGTFSR